MNNADQQFEKTGYTLPPAAAPAGLYKPCLTEGTRLYLSGHLPVRSDGSLITGRIGQDLSAQDGQLAARQAALNMLATIKENLGSLNRVKRVLKLFGMVNGTPEFDQHPYVINGCSELLAQVWGNDNGIGTRSAVGMASLPGNVPVEIEAIFELYP